MVRINVGHLILRGIVARIVGDVLGYLVDGVLLAARWTFAMQKLGTAQFSSNQWMVFNLIGLVYGILAMWL